MKNLELRDQNNVRGKWLKASLVMLGANFLMAIASLVSGEMIEGAIILFFGAINFIITYVTSYRRFGTYWLCYILVVMPLSFYKELASDVDLSTSLFLFVGIPLMAWYWFSTLQLYRFNRKKKALQIVQANINEYAVRAAITEV